MHKERFQKQLDFILEIDKEKNILRQTHLTGYTRQENDAEHAWHMAIMIYLLKEYANEEFDVTKAIEINKETKEPIEADKKVRRVNGDKEESINQVSTEEEKPKRRVPQYNVINYK